MTDTYQDEYEGEEEQGYEDEYDYSNDPNVQRVEQPQKANPVVIPIGEAVTAETLHGVVAFTRSLNLGSRDNNAHYRCEMPFVVQPGWPPEQCAAQAADAFYQCVAVVLQQAGLPFTVGEDGVLREVLRSFPGAREVEQDRPRRDRDDDRREDNGSPASSFPHPADLRRPDHIRDSDWRDLCDHYDDYYDNRDDKHSGQAGASSPDFKHKDSGKGLWLTPFRREGGGGNRGGNRRQYERR